MEIHQHEQLLEQIDALLEAMNEHEVELYLAIEAAHQLRDEIAQIEPEEPEEE